MSTTRQQRDNGAEGESFGPYLVYERLGVGGMATVHRARERGIEGFERIVALKRLLPHMAEDASFVRAFVREAKLASMLQHANIVQIYELGRVGSEYFISMEYIEGRDVRRLLRQARKVTGPPPIPVVVGILLQVCDALDYAHTRLDEQGQPLGLVHRDVSPSNLIITPSGHVKVIDFGIAKAQSQHLRTHTGRVKGKLAYMSPEATRGHKIDHRSDLFSLGVICHELLTARPLFATRNDYDTLTRVQSGEVVPPSTYNQRCPAELDAISLKALAKDAAQRWQSAAEMRDALDEVRQLYQMEASHRTIASWASWAFTQEAPPSTAHSAAPSSSDTPVRVNFSAPGSRDAAPPVAQEPPAAPLPPVESDDEVVEIAWGGRDDGVPVLLDEVPDVSDKVVLPASATPEPEGRLPTDPPGWADGSARGSATAAGARRAATEFGAAIVERGRGGRRGAIAAAALALAGLGALALLVISGRGDQAAAEVATLRFSVEPDDAVIAVEGSEPHTGSPHTTEVSPGSYRIEISRDGYQSWVSTIDIDAGERQTVRVALQPGGRSEARLSVRSTPPGLEVTIDGRSEGVTPLSVPVDPGARVVALHSPDGRVWQHQLDTSADTQYELHPMLEEEVKRLRRQRRREQRQTVVGSDSPIVSEDGAAASPRGGPAARAGSPGLLPLPLGSERPPEPEREPVVIPPGAARKVSGQVPEIRLRSGAELPAARASAKMCIDTGGRVTSVSILTRLPDEVIEVLTGALGRWRFQPHTEDGRAVPACFVQTFRIR